MEKQWKGEMSREVGKRREVKTLGHVGGRCSGLGGSGSATQLACCMLKPSGSQSSHLGNGISYMCSAFLIGFARSQETKFVKKRLWKTECCSIPRQHSSRKSVTLSGSSGFGLA